MFYFFPCILVINLLAPLISILDTHQFFFSLNRIFSKNNSSPFIHLLTQIWSIHLLWQRHGKHLEFFRLTLFTAKQLSAHIYVIYIFACGWCSKNKQIFSGALESFGDPAARAAAGCKWHVLLWPHCKGLCILGRKLFIWSVSVDHWFGNYMFPLEDGTADIQGQY